MVVTEEIKKEWFRAISLDSIGLTSEHVKAFKCSHPEEYNLFHSFYRLRHDLNADIELMTAVGSCHWFTLTFDNKRDKSLVSSKRKAATRFLNDIFLLYEMVEEYGEDKGRYHIHGFGVFNEGKGFKDFIKWPSRTKIQDLNKTNLKKKVAYLTKYAVKSLPRRRRSKRLVALYNKEKEFKGLKQHFGSCYSCKFNIAVFQLKTLGCIIKSQSTTT